MTPYFEDWMLELREVARTERVDITDEAIDAVDQDDVWWSRYRDGDWPKDALNLVFPHDKTEATTPDFEAGADIEADTPITVGASQARQLSAQLGECWDELLADAKRWRYVRDNVKAWRVTSTGVAIDIGDEAWLRGETLTSTVDHAMRKEQE